MALSFKYKKRDPALLEKRAEGQTGRFQGIIKNDYKLWRPVKGGNFIRILPPTWDDADHYGLDVFSHYSVGPERATVLCLTRMKSQPCPICQAKLRADKADDKELSNELRANRQVLVWMVDMKDKAKGPMIAALASTIDENLAKVSIDEEGISYLIDHPENGYNVSFDRDGEGITTKYSGFKLARNPTSIEQEWLDFVVQNPLPDCLVWRTYDEVKRLFEGGAPEEDEDERPVRPKVKAKTPEPEEDPEEADEAEVDEPEPEVKPAFKPRGKAAAKEPEPDEEDEPAPAKKPEPAVSGAGRAASLRERFAKK